MGTPLKLGGRPRHTDDRHYQFRASKELDDQIQKIWLKDKTTTQNMTRIILAGVLFLQPTKGE